LSSGVTMTETRDSDSPYQPIACDLYSQFELAIMHRQRIRLRWIEENVIHDQAVTPIDLQTLQHAEFLVCRAGAAPAFRVRLDRIRHWEAL
jgi:Rho-binding antiterminator